MSNGPDDSGTDNEYVTLGKIIGFFGVKGWVKVHSDTNPRQNIVNYPQWWLGGSRNRQPIKVIAGKRSGKNVVARLDGIDTREKAELLLGKEIAVTRSMLPELDENEYYWTDLIGCEVATLQGVVIGPVERMFETGANDVMVVTDHRGSLEAGKLEAGRSETGSLEVEGGSKSVTGSESVKGEVLIPWIRPSVIISVDLAARKIVVD